MGSSEEPYVNQDLKEGKDPAVQRAEERAFQVEGTWCTESLVNPRNWKEATVAGAGSRLLQKEQGACR